MSAFDEKHPHPSAEGDTHAQVHHEPLGHSATFKADDVMHPDMVNVVEDNHSNGADDNEEFPYEEHQFTW